MTPGVPDLEAVEVSKEVTEKEQEAVRCHATSPIGWLHQSGTENLGAYLSAVAGVRNLGSNHVTNIIPHEHCPRHISQAPPEMA